MSVFNGPVTELTTSATDLGMALLSLVLLRRLRALKTRALWSQQIWSWVFQLLLTASVLGAAAHGLALSNETRALLWLPLYLSLGLAIALFLVGAVCDWRGERTARRLLPWAITAGVVFFGLSQLLGGAFIIFVIYEAVAMVVALVLYLAIAARSRSPGAWLVSAGIALTLAAAAIQASTLQARIVVPFDHNGLFHLVQMLATIILARGVHRLLASASGGSQRSPSSSSTMAGTTATTPAR